MHAAAVCGLYNGEIIIDERIRRRTEIVRGSEGGREKEREV
jgi:hypothetical protein